MVNWYESTPYTSNSTNKALQRHYIVFPDGPYLHSTEASFTPDGQFVLCGTKHGRVNVWEATTGNPVALWTAPSLHPGPVGRVLFNPKRMMAASACSQVAFWLPEGI